MDKNEIVRVPESESQPKFLQDMEQELPQLAHLVSSRIDSWKEQVDDISGKEKFSSLLLESMEYVSEAEILDHVNFVTQEIQSQLRDNPEKRITFLTHLKRGGSQLWFYERIEEQLEKQFRERIDLVEANDLESDDFDEGETVFYFVDDSINSGKQFKAVTNQLLRSTQEHSSEIKLHVRCLRINQYGLDYQRARYLLTRCNVNLDLDEVSYSVNTPMVTTKDVLEKTNLEISDIDNDGLVIRTSPASNEYGTLTFFWHKIQDNMPPVVIDKKRLDWSLLKKEDEDLVAEPYPKGYKTKKT